MNPTLKHMSITLCEPNGDTIMVFDVNNQISTMIPNIGEEVSVDGLFRKVINKTFSYLPNTESVVVMIYLEEFKEKESLYSFK